MILVKPLTLFFPPLIERIYISSSFSSSIPWEWVFFMFTLGYYTFFLKLIWLVSAITALMFY